MNKNTNRQGIDKIPLFVIHPFNDDEKLNFEALRIFQYKFLALTL